MATKTRIMDNYYNNIGLPDLFNSLSQTRSEIRIRIAENPELSALRSDNPHVVGAIGALGGLLIAFAEPCNNPIGHLRFSRFTPKDRDIGVPAPNGHFLRRAELGNLAEKLTSMVLREGVSRQREDPEREDRDCRCNLKNESVSSAARGPIFAVRVQNPILPLHRSEQPHRALVSRPFRHGSSPSRFFPVCRDGPTS